MKSNLCIALRTLVFGFSAAVWMLAGDPASAVELQHVTFALNWSPTDHHIAYWVAVDKGYYAKQGLDVELQYSKGSGDAIARVDTNRAEFGLTDTMAFIPALARGSKAKVVGMVIDKTLLNIFLWQDSPIKTPKDLAGKTLGAPAGDAQRLLFPAFSKVVGIDPNSVSWVTIDPGAKVGALLAKRVDAVADFTTDLPAFQKVMGRENVRMMPWADYGFNLYSMAIIARSDLIAKQPEMVRKFLLASYQGWRDVFADLDGSLAIYKKHAPEIDTNLMRQSLSEITLPSIKTPVTVAHGIGYIDGAKMCETVRLINDNMKLPEKVDCSAAYDAKLIPHVDFPN